VLKEADWKRKPAGSPTGFFIEGCRGQNALGLFACFSGAGKEKGPQKCGPF
jgi:hypothetical protein